MRPLLKFVAFLLLTYGCTKESAVVPGPGEVTGQLLRTFYSTDPGLSFASRNFTYSEGFLTEYMYTNEDQNYFYDQSGRLLASEGLSSRFEYTYDGEDRLIQVERLVDGQVNGLFELSYADRQVTIEFSQPGFDFRYTYIHNMDAQGRTTSIEGDEEGFRYLVSYQYDAAGNILERSFLNRNTLEESTRTYTYLDLKNPFYESYKKLNTSIYPFNVPNQISLEMVFGNTPNILDREDYAYSSEDGIYPTEVLITNENGVFQWIFEYYQLLD